MQRAGRCSLFLHGGGWAIGWGSNALLDGRHLAAALDAVIVTVNYRLGSLGWLDHPALAAATHARGNWGLLDQLAALRWVRDNIASFGGDPSRVTLGGESAGAGSVLHLIGHPDAQGLFHRAITLSPPLHELVVERALGERWTAALSMTLGLGDDVGAALPALRALPADAIVAAQEKLLAGGFKGSRGGALPITDPNSLPADPATVPGAAPQVPLLIGTNAQEGTFFFRAGGRRIDPGPEQLRDMVARVAHVASDAVSGPIGRAYERLASDGIPDPTANDVLCAVVTEAWFAGPVSRYAATRAAAGATVHRYRIEHPSPDPDDLGALHTISVPLLFGSWREGGIPAGSPARRTGPPRSPQRSRPTSAASSTASRSAGRPSEPAPSRSSTGARKAPAPCARRRPTAQPAQPEADRQGRTRPPSQARYGAAPAWTSSARAA